MIIRSEPKYHTEGQEKRCGTKVVRTPESQVFSDTPATEGRMAVRHRYRPHDSALRLHDMSS